MLFDEPIKRLTQRQLNHSQVTLLIGLSGGLDSTVLLNAASEAFQQGALVTSLLAVHVHHGLQAEADEWASHAETFAQTKNIPIQTIRMDAKPSKGESPEAKARHVRYAAFARVATQLQAQGQMVVLATGHHQDDQAETLLLQLIRGAGVEGLSAMPELKPWVIDSKIDSGGGVDEPLYENLNNQVWHWRPLLSISRQQLQAYAEQHHLSWIEDPSNQSLEYDRNFIRQRVLPLLSERWPSAKQTIARSASLLGEQADVTDQLIQKQLQTEANGWVLNTADFSEMPTSQQRLWVRCWLKSLSMSRPSQAQLEEILNIIRARRGCVQWDEASLSMSLKESPVCNQVRAYRNQLFAYSHQTWQPWDFSNQHSNVQFDWVLSEQFPMLEGLPSAIQECLSAQAIQSLGADAVAKTADRYCITFNPKSSERVYWAGKPQSEQIKHAFQRLCVPPWLRSCCPVLRRGDMIKAIISIKNYGYV